MIHEQYYIEQEKVARLVGKKNKKSGLYNGIFDRYEDPVLTREHIPVDWRYDINKETNPYFMERLGVNAVFNAGAIYLDGKFYLVARVEGADRKSFFAVAESDNGVDGFHFWDYPVELPDTCKEETNVYDMRLTKHEDGYIYGVFCSESKDTKVNDLSAAVAAAGIVRTKDLKHWERLDNLVTLRSPQQRNVVLHPEFVDGKYAFYTRPMDDFIETGSGGGIGFGLCEDIAHAVIDEERITSLRKYHTITEAKNGAGVVPIKTERGYIHIAHGVRNTAAGLRYVLYCFATALDDPAKVIAEPSGAFLVPRGEERIGDVSNVVFTCGAVVTEKNEVYLYYASSDTRMHVATTTLEKLIDYVFETPEDPLRSRDCVAQRVGLIAENKKLLSTEISPDNKELVYSGRIDWYGSYPAFLYPCTSVTIHFEGASCKVTVKSERQNWNSYVCAIVDGEMKKFLLEDGVQTVTLWEGEMGEHTIVVFKPLDASNRITLYSISLGEGGRLLKAVEKPKRRIEIYGDSVSAGELSEAVDYVGQPDPPHNAEYSNSYYSYGWIAARKLGAEIHDIAQGGVGLLRDTGYFNEPDYIGMDQVYDKTMYHPAYGEVTDWDFTKYTPHVVIVSIGQNDNFPRDYMKEDYDGSRAFFWKLHYKWFIEKLRAHYPKALIILQTTILNHHPNWDRAIDDVCKQLNDEKVVHFLYENNGCGTPGHVRRPEAEHMADQLVKFIEGFGEEIWQ